MVYNSGNYEYEYGEVVSVANCWVYMLFLNIMKISKTSVWKFERELTRALPFPKNGIKLLE